MADEGIGTFLGLLLAAQSAKFPEVDFIDAGTGGMSILHLIAGRHKAVIIDCAQMGTAAGTMKKFTPEEVESTKLLRHQSLHEADILRIVQLSKRLGQLPEQVIFFGIEPSYIGPNGKLSNTLAEKIDNSIDAILKEIGC